MTFPKGDQKSLKAYYGDPDTNSDGQPDIRWEMENLTYIKPPYGMVLAWDIKRPVSQIRVHKSCAASLLSALEKIAGHYGSQKAIEAARMHLFGGCYNFRIMRTGPNLSVHAYGAAIDLDPANNPLGRKYSPDRMMPIPVINIFKELGWKWGGTFPRPDCMHFEATS